MWDLSLVRVCCTGRRSGSDRIPESRGFVSPVKKRSLTRIDLGCRYLYVERSLLTGMILSSISMSSHGRLSILITLLRNSAKVSVQNLASPAAQYLNFPAGIRLSYPSPFSCLCQGQPLDFF